MTEMANLRRVRPGGPPGGFTLVELLVVIAIIGILAGLVLPAVQQSREASRGMACRNNLKQLAIAAQLHADGLGCFPSGVDQSFFPTPPVYRGSSVFVQLLPYMEQTNLGAQWELSDPILNADAGPGSRTAVVLPWLLCPSDDIPQNPIQSRRWTYALTSYGGNGGTRAFYPELATTDGIFHTTGPASEPKPNQKPVRIADVRDGTSQTLLFGERYHRDRNFESFAQAGWIDSLYSWGWWAPSGGRKSIGHVTMSAAAPINFDLPFPYMAGGPTNQATVFRYYSDLRLNGWGSGHPGGANFAFADGSVRFLGDGISQVLLQALSTRRGGEMTDGP